MAHVLASWSAQGKVARSVRQPAVQPSFSLLCELRREHAGLWLRRHPVHPSGQHRVAALALAYGPTQSRKAHTQ